LSIAAAQEDDNIVPSNYTAIPQGATNRNFPDYWQDGTYRIITTYNNEMRLEIN
jgi:hypothetical protein